MGFSALPSDIQITFNRGLDFLKYFIVGRSFCDTSGDTVQPAWLTVVCPVVFQYRALHVAASRTETCFLIPPQECGRNSQVL